MDNIFYLVEKYPNLYKNGMCFECGPGWKSLLDELSNKLENLILAGKWGDFPPYATRVKEKYGTLSFYMSTATNEMFKIIEEYEEKSHFIDELTGNPGKLKCVDGWWRVMQDEQM